MNAFAADMGRVVPLIVGPIVPPALVEDLTSVVDQGSAPAPARKQAATSAAVPQPTLAANEAPAVWAWRSVSSLDLQSPIDQIVLTQVIIEAALADPVFEQARGGWGDGGVADTSPTSGLAEQRHIVRVPTEAAMLRFTQRSAAC